MSRHRPESPLPGEREKPAEQIPVKDTDNTSAPFRRRGNAVHQADIGLPGESKQFGNSSGSTSNPPEKDADSHPPNFPAQGSAELAVLNGGQSAGKRGCFYILEENKSIVDLPGILRYRRSTTPDISKD
jgi:hypothetical protein